MTMQEFVDYCEQHCVTFTMHNECFGYPEGVRGITINATVTSPTKGRDVYIETEVGMNLEEAIQDCYDGIESVLKGE